MSLNMHTTQYELSQHNKILQDIEFWLIMYYLNQPFCTEEGIKSETSL